MESLCYNAEDLQETFGCLPTTSIVLQVSIISCCCSSTAIELILQKGKLYCIFLTGILQHDPHALIINGTGRFILSCV